MIFAIVPISKTPNQDWILKNKDAEQLKITLASGTGTNPSQLSASWKTNLKDNSLHVFLSFNPSDNLSSEEKYKQLDKIVDYIKKNAQN